MTAETLAPDEGLRMGRPVNVPTRSKVQKPEPLRESETSPFEVSRSKLLEPPDYNIASFMGPR